MEVLLLTPVRLIYLSWRHRFVGHKYLFLFWKMLPSLTLSGVNIGRGLFSAKSWYLLSSNFPQYWPECERYFSSYHKAIYYGNGCSKMPIIEDNGVRRGKKPEAWNVQCAKGIFWQHILSFLYSFPSLTTKANSGEDSEKQDVQCAKGIFWHILSFSDSSPHWGSRLMPKKRQKSKAEK